MHLLRGAVVISKGELRICVGLMSLAHQGKLDTHRAGQNRTCTPYMTRVGQNCKYTPYMPVFLVISLPKLPEGVNG